MESLLGDAIRHVVHAGELLLHTFLATGSVSRRFHANFVATTLCSLHGKSLAFFALDALFLGHLLAPLGHFHLVMRTKFRFFVHVLLTERRLGFLPCLGKHLGKIRIGGIGVLTLESRASLVGKGEEGGHRTLGCARVLGRTFVGRYLPRSLVHGLFYFVTGLVFTSFLLPDFLFFRVEFTPSFRNHLGNIRRLFDTSIFCQPGLDFLVLFSTKDDKGGFETLGSIGCLLVLGRSHRFG
mmetsp:Transcript_12135/g.23194  ORF Transcript_12135/g.23194 Transcript_12135/m.23194 type:complete len:239 (-) Transcript_12135:216-932(-)